MIYTIDYIPSRLNLDSSGLPIISIDFYMRKIEKNEWNAFQQQYPKSELWESGIKTETHGYGLANFIEDKLNNNKFNVQGFAEDIDNIENLADIIDFRSDSHPKPYKEAETYHYQVIKPILDDKINEFAKKYKLTLNID